MHYWARIMQFLYMQTFYPVHVELPKVVNNSLGCLREILYVLDWSHSYIFRISYIDV